MTSRSLDSVTQRGYFVVGTRPEIVKLSPVIEAWIRARRDCFIVHTGQHQVPEMVQVIFDDLDLPPPDRMLAVGSDSQVRQVARIMHGVEETIRQEGDGIVIVQGDTNSTLGAALAAVGLEKHIVVHVESGCRSFNRRMPEEVNRIVVDHVCDLLFAATTADVENLCREGLADRTFHVGSTGVEACLRNVGKAVAKSSILSLLDIKKGMFGLVTVHRVQNTDDGATLSRIFQALAILGEEARMVFPVHPRTEAALKRHGILWPESVIRVPPLRYLDFLALLSHARFVLTDSGGVQEEAACLGTRCFTLRDETEWTFTLHSGLNTLVGTDPRRIVAIVGQYLEQGTKCTPVNIRWPTGKLPSEAITRRLSDSETS
jgi:UDP-N-acetylglucosamine 2-epimerase